MPESSNHSSGPEVGPPSPRFSRAVAAGIMVAISLALLIPCIWQSRIQAGDLSSHLYNAWLTRQIKAGAVQGLKIVPVSTNVLTDWALERLMLATGPVATERAVVGTSVLVFFWGAFLAIGTAAKRPPWLFCPFLGMLSYGLVLHLGFLNFYLSTGLCLWILALLWDASWKRALAVAPLAILAWLAHALPVVWVFSVLGYLHLTRRIPPAWRVAAPVGGVALLAAAQTILMNRYLYRWSLDQTLSLVGLAGVTGLEQFWLYDPKYLILSGILLLFWIALFLERIDQGDLLIDVSGQIWVLHVVAFVLMPSAIQLPQYQHVLAYIPQRLSLLTALSFCIMVGRARYGRGITRLTGVAATVFFTCLYLDGLAFNQVEGQVAALVEKLPPGQRVVAAISDSGARFNALLHVADRPCIGKCFSYANYEPATGQFRIRLVGTNRVVASSMKTVQEIEEGQHIVTPAEEPLYSVCPCEREGNRLCLRALRAGEQTCAFSRPVSLHLWSEAWQKAWDKAAQLVP